MSANYDDKATSLESKESNEHLDDVDHVDFNRNTTARIQNPLHGLSRKTLHERADTFATETSVDVDRDLLYKAIVLAQRPSEFETNEDLTEADREALRLERDHRWKQPFILYFTVFLCSLGAAVQGWDQTGSNGANLSFPQEFGIPLDDPVHAEANEWLVGVINAGPYIGSALLGCPISDPLNTWIGRRGVIFVSAIFCCFPVLAQGFTQSWEQLFICRLLLGIGMGVKGSTIPIYAAENVPTAIRGGLVMSWQLWTAFGICVGFAFNLIFKDMGPLAWRFQLSCAFAPAVPLAALIYLCPESPRWLMKKGNQAKAWRSFCRLRNTELQAARDMILVWSQLREEAAIIKPASYLVRVKELFTIPRVRRATLASFIVMLGQQMCGINIIAFYSSTVFAIAGYNTTQCLLASFGFGLVNFIFAFPAVYTIDTFGRRSLLLATFPNMAWRTPHAFRSSPSLSSSSPRSTPLAKALCRSHTPPRSSLYLTARSAWPGPSLHAWAGQPSSVSRSLAWSALSPSRAPSASTLVST